MPRRPYKRLPIKPDQIYHSIEIAKLINYVMRDGKKSVAERMVYSALDAIKSKGADPIQTVTTALQNVAPTYEVKPKRVGGASYLVPIETRPARKLFLAFNWIIDAALAKSSKDFKTFSAKLVAELTDASQGLGEAVGKRKQVEKLAEANKAFSHFRW